MVGLRLAKVRGAQIRISSSQGPTSRQLRNLPTTTKDLIIFPYQIAKMAPSNLPPIFNATSQDIEMLLSAQCHLGSKNMQVHMEPYLYKTRPDGVNILNIGKTWYVVYMEIWSCMRYAEWELALRNAGVAFSWNLKFVEFELTTFVLGRRLSSLPVSSQLSTTQPIFVSSLPALTANVLSSSSLLTPVLLPLPVVSPPVTSPTTLPVRSRSHA